MSVLSAAERKKLKPEQFGLPGERKYPMPDRAHAINAKARASQAADAGRISEATEEKIIAKANRVLKRR